MRFATFKTLEQQAVPTLHRSREILVKQQTMLANLIRGCLGEFGIVAPLGIRRVSELIALINDDAGSFGRRTIHQGQRHCRANRPDTNLQPA